MTKENSCFLEEKEKVSAELNKNENLVMDNTSVVERVTVCLTGAVRSQIK